MMPYNLRVEHVRGVDNNIADFGSRYPRNTSEGEEFEILRPTICTKSRRVQEVQFDSADPKVEKLARIASECPQYQMIMIHHILRDTPVKEIEDTSELKRMQGGLQDLQSIRQTMGTVSSLEMERRCSYQYQKERHY